MLTPTSPSQPVSIDHHISKRPSHQFKLFLDVIIIVSGLSTIISVFVAMFLLNGLNMLSITTIALSSVLILIGTMFISVGLLFLVNSLYQGVVLSLQQQRIETNNANLLEKKYNP